MLEIPENLIFRFARLTVLQTSNLISAMKQFNIPYFSISTILLYHCKKNLLPNIYLLNNKQDLKTHLNET